MSFAGAPRVDRSVGGRPRTVLGHFNVDDRLGRYELPDEGRQQFGVQLSGSRGRQRADGEPDHHADDGADGVVVQVRNRVQFPHVRAGVHVFV